MRIPCPYCGERDSGEFVYHGASMGPRPQAAAEMVAHVYLRDNPAGENAELWYHGGGCRAWLEIRRDTRTHAIGAVRMMRAEAAR